MAKVKIYEYVEGLNIDCPLIDSEGEQVPIIVIQDCKFFVLRPGETEEEEWDTVLVAPNIVRHTVPTGADLAPGKYKIQPYIETVDGYKGRCESFELQLSKKFS